MKPLKVLIIEDDRSSAGFFKNVLQLAGLESEVSYSAKEALDRLASTVPDLILLDIRLGHEISGEDILYQIRSNPRFDKTRVVVITGYPHLADPISDLADLVLVKPVESDQLKNLMQRLKRMDFRSKFQNFRDPTTDLFNEDFYLSRLELAFERTRRRPDFYFAIIAIDFQIDPSQEARVTPDSTLIISREIASRLKKNIRPTDAAARLSGWKFATLHEDLKDLEEVQVILKRLREKLSLPYAIPDGPVQILCALELVQFDSTYEKAVDILSAAQKAVDEQETRANSDQ